MLTLVPSQEVLLKKPKGIKVEDSKPILVDRYRPELLLQAKGMRLYPVLMGKKDCRVDITGWLLFNQIGYLKCNEKGKKSYTSEYYTPSLKYLHNTYFPWSCVDNISDHLRILELEGYITIDRKRGCWNTYDLTEGGKELYLKDCIDAEEHYITVYPELVKGLGSLNAAIILARLHFSSYKQEELTRSINNMQEKLFPNIFTLSTFKRGLDVLWKSGLLYKTRTTETGEGSRGNRANSYTIDYQLLASKYFPLKGEVIHDNKTFELVYPPKPY